MSDLYEELYADKGAPDARPDSSDQAIVVLGPTACGKTRLAVKLAGILNGEIISVDSRQVYRGLDIGTGKDIKEYGNTPRHLIDVASPLQEYSLFEYLSDVASALQQIRQKKCLPVFAGGTGLYLDALLQSYRLSHAPVNEALHAELEGLPLQTLVARLSGLKPAHNSTDVLDPERTIRALEIALAEQAGDCEHVQIRLSPYVIGIACEGDQLRQRIKRRMESRFAEGMIDEVQKLRNTGVSWQKLDSFGLEYRYIARYLQGMLNNNDMQQKLASAIYQFARQQLKWFRRMERKGVCINWLDIASLNPDEGEMPDTQLKRIVSQMRAKLYPDRQ